MKKDSVILVLLFSISTMLSIVCGMFWRTEEVYRLRRTIDLKNNTILQTETYLNQFDFNDIAKNNWRQLGYIMYSKQEIVKQKK